MILMLDHDQSLANRPRVSITGPLFAYPPDLVMRPWSGRTSRPKRIIAPVWETPLTGVVSDLKGVSLPPQSVERRAFSFKNPPHHDRRQIHRELVTPQKHKELFGLRRA